jgi:hypothetical protein
MFTLNLTTYFMDVELFFVIGYICIYM